MSHYVCHEAYHYLSRSIPPRTGPTVGKEGGTKLCRLGARRGSVLRGRRSGAKHGPINCRPVRQRGHGHLGTRRRSALEGPPLLIALADTGAIYALIDQSDVWHRRVIAWWRSTRQSVLVPVTVLPELVHLLNTRIGDDAELAFVRAIADGEFAVEQLEIATDLERTAEIMSMYHDQSIGWVDASVVAMAERLGVNEIVTTDRRHFGVIQPRHVREFTLLP